MSDKQPLSNLEVHDQSLAQVRDALAALHQVRDLEGHPDSGGTSARLRKLEAAREALLDPE